MTNWLVYDREGASRNKDYIEYHHTLGAKYEFEFELILAEECDDIFIDEKLKKYTPGFVIVRTINPKLSQTLENKGLKVYNTASVSYITNHKGRCVDYVRKNTSVPTIPTEIISKEIQSENDITEIIKRHPGYVLKSASGHGGTSVIRISEDISTAINVIRQNSNDDFIIQPFIEGPGEDVRVYIIGTTIIAAVKRHAPTTDFRANASLGGKVTPHKLSDTEVRCVQSIISAFNHTFGMVGIDFIINSSGDFIFNEIEDVVGSRMLYKTYPNIDILDLYFKYLSKNYTA